MNTDVARYRKFRSEGVPARYAIEWARASLIAYQEGDLDDSITIQRGEFAVVVTWTVEDYADLSHHGQFVDRPQHAGAIRLHDGRDHRTYQYFEPMITAAEHRCSLNGKLGYSRQVAQELAESYVRIDLKAARGDSFPPLIITARAYKADVLLGESVLGGVEVSEDWPTVEDVVLYLSGDTSTIDDAVDSATAALARLRD